MKRGQKTLACVEGYTILVGRKALACVEGYTVLGRKALACVERLLGRKALGCEVSHVIHCLIYSTWYESSICMKIYRHKTTDNLRKKQINNIEK